MLLNTKQIILALILLPSTSRAADIAFPAWDTIKKMSVAAAVTFIPGKIVYDCCSDNKPEDILRDAQNTLTLYYDRLRAFTVDEINYALRITKMNPQELQEEINNQALAYGICASIISGLIYWLIQRKPIHPATSVVRHYYTPYYPRTYAAPAPLYK